MKKFNRNAVFIILLFVSMALIFTGISIAVFNYFGTGMTNNVIQTGKIIFSYNEEGGISNGINIQDALPVPDETGKVLSGSHEYFEFSVSATTPNTNLTYEIVAKKGEDSTLAEDNVKIYLTSFEGNSEVATPLTTNNGSVVTYSELKDTTNPLLTGKTIYYGEVKAGEVSYGKRFCLRMWVKQSEEGYNFEEINDKTFSVKVDVAATSVY